MKDDPPLRVPDPSATIPDFGPRPDLSKAPNLAALMGGPSPMVETPERAKEAAPPPRPAAPPPPVSKAGREAQQQQLTPPPPEPSEGPSMAMLIGVSLLLAILAGAIAFGLTLIVGILALFFVG
ncbi:MAG: hypothetical protein KC656_02165 [Myxococcales bacterium]|nr:hypothetical protein [Myxococcales bacterium]